MISIIFLVSFIASLIQFPWMIPALKKAKIIGKDVHKPGLPEIADMGGITIVFGFTIGIVVVVFLRSFTDLLDSVNLLYTLAAFSTVLVIALIGILDDLIDLKQWVKAIIPVFAALPLMAIKAGDSSMTIPVIGEFEFGLVYSLVLVPVGITVAANAVNMLAGFNGMEVGMGMVAMASLTIIAARLGEITAMVILLAGLGALLATFRYNWFPAKVFVGDVGTLSIGAIIAASVIIGNFEVAGVIIMIPYVVEFFIKAKNRLPSLGWWGILRDGKLYCPETGYKGLGQLIMKLTGGISERGLTLTFMGIEAVFGVLAIWMFW
jgi:UDP-N-acetylglucosamine--dolichyl-phosphate N-acetylglucosaminephosphotransferase